MVVQLFDMYIGPAAPLRRYGSDGLYCVLATLHFGVHICSSQTSRGSRFASHCLKYKLMRSDHGNGGLCLRFQNLMNKRDREPDLASLTVDAARSHMLIAWDRLEFKHSFTFPERYS